MLDDYSWSHPPKSICNDFCDRDFNKQAISLASNDTKMNSHILKNSYMDTVGTEIFGNNPIGVAMVDGHNLFENDCEEKESSDHLFVGWPDTVTLEDANSMYRSFGSTFGCGEFGNEDEFSWFSSQCIDGSDAVMKSDFRFPFSESKYIVEQDGPYKAVNTASSVNDSSCCTSVNGTTEVQMSNLKKRTKIYNQSEGSVKDRYLENGGSCHDGGIGGKAFTSSVRPHSFGYLQNSTPLSEPGMKSQSSCVTLSSPPMEEFSNFLNGVCRTDSRLDISFEAPSTSIDKSKKLRYNPECVDAASYDPTVSTQVQYSEVENHYEIEGARKRSLENLDFSNVPETSYLSSKLDTTLEASRLSQLQQVMHQLDVRTILCLRDGLYRLARSAEQRHLSASANVRNIDDGVTNGMPIDEETKESNDPMDIESETNPIDRSIAHLLFHRSSDLSTNSACNGSSLKSHTMVDGFIDSPPSIAEK